MIQYPYLPEGRQLLYVSAENFFMKEAMAVCMETSTDDKQPTGAVIVQNGKTIGRGSNQTALKIARLRKLHENGWCVRRVLGIKSGEKYWLCPGCAGYDTHAEARAIQDVADKKDVVGADLYLWGHWWCCKPCWDKIISAGIKNVYVLQGSEVLFNRSESGNKLGRQNFTFFVK